MCPLACDGCPSHMGRRGLEDLQVQTKSQPDLFPKGESESGEAEATGP